VILAGVRKGKMFVLRGVESVLETAAFVGFEIA
jgi:hypothetical protein